MKQGTEKFLWLRGPAWDLTQDGMFKEPKVFTKDKMIYRKEKRIWRKKIARREIKEYLNH
ncbi:MAG: hypothetical protein M0Q88_01245 [Bacilli bacterium]|nr:hypothetical protein [Bacilli bacterium]